MELTLAELAARTRLPKPTAYRLLRELRAWGGVEQTSTGGYRLGMHLFTLAQRAPWQRELRHHAYPYLEDLYEATHENVHLAVFHGTDTLFLEKLTGHRSTPIISRVGSRMLCRDLDRTIDRGYVVNVEESEVGVVAVAAPVYDRRRRVIASISVTGGAHRLAVDRFAPTVCMAARALSEELASTAS